MILSATILPAMILPAGGGVRKVPARELLPFAYAVED